MNTELSRRLVAWILIIAMSNPAWALDTDIYRAIVTGSSAAEPNVLLILDTSDSMNLPEGWREYPGGYDSHVEYLWNDIDIISNTEVSAEQDGKISDGNSYVPASPSDTTPLPAPTKPLGFWGGSSVEERSLIWSAARDYANATGPGDPGPRSIYRNYSERNALYWLPAGIAESDPRLHSNAFNQFYGADALTTFGGTIDPVTHHLKRGGIDFGTPPAKYYACLSG